MNGFWTNLYTNKKKKKEVRTEVYNDKLKKKTK